MKGKRGLGKTLKGLLLMALREAAGELGADKLASYLAKRLGAHYVKVMKAWKREVDRAVSKATGALHNRIWLLELELSKNRTVLRDARIALKDTTRWRRSVFCSDPDCPCHVHGGKR